MMVRKTFIFFLACIVSISINATTEVEDCAPLSQETAELLEEVNKDKNISGIILKSLMNSQESAEKKRAFFSALSPQNRAVLFSHHLSEQLSKNEYNSEQVAFIKKVIRQAAEFYNWDNTDTGNITKMQLLEIEAGELFDYEEARKLFIIGGNDVKKPQTAMASLDERPPCDCRTDSSFACIGCTLKGQNCYWRNRGCGFGGWYSCNGKCPLQ